MSIVEREKVVAALPAYEIGEQLGEGSFGLVLEGRHRELGRQVAIKVLSTGRPEDSLANFKGEARALAGLDHPHIVGIYDYVEYRGLHLIIMKLLSGGTLTQNRGRLSPEAACAVGLAAADALFYAHSCKVLHRDVKPDNMIFSGDGLLKVTDFGIAKMFEGSADTASKLAGTPRYMAPEQFEMGRLGPPTDLYALSAVLYELLSGGPPFDPGLSFGALYRHHLEVVPPPPPGVPESIGAVVMRSLKKDPASRHPSAHAFALDLAVAAAWTYGPGWITRSGITLHIAEDVRVAASNGSAGRPIDATPPAGPLISTAPPPSDPVDVPIFSSPPVPGSRGDGDPILEPLPPPGGMPTSSRFDALLCAAVILMGALLLVLPL